MKTAWLGVLGLALIIGGCASSSSNSIERRKAQRPEAFAALTQNQQRIVLQGRITEGLSKDGVFIALGRPLRVRQGRIDGVTTESWIYGRMETHTSPGMSMMSMHGPRGRYFGTGFHQRTVSVMRDTFVVHFNQAGRVRGWQEL